MQGVDHKELADLDDRLLTSNGLKYEAPVELSLASSIRQRSFPALKEIYSPGDSGFIDISLGTDLLDPKRSFLTFDVQTSPWAAGQANTLTLDTKAGAVGLFRQVLVRTRAGLEVSRSEWRNLQACHENSVNLPYGASTIIGRSMGQGSAIASGGGGVGNFGAKTTFSVPLSAMSPFFNTHMLVPTAQLGQLRLEFVFNSVPLMGVWTHGVAASSVQISGVNLWTQAVTLADSALRALTIIAANTGLSYFWDEIHTTIQPHRDSLNMMTTKAASKAIGAWLHSVNDADQTDQNDNLRTIPADADDRIMWNLGSTYFPVREIEGIQQLFSHFAVNSGCHVQSLYDRVPDITRDEWIANRNFQEVSLERSDILQGNGSATSSSRPLQVQRFFGIADGAAKTTYLFLKYVRLLTIFSDGNAVLKE